MKPIPSLLIGALAGLAVEPRVGPAAAPDLDARARRLKQRVKGTTVFGDSRSIARSRRRAGEVSPREQRKAEKILRAVRRGASSYAGKPIILKLEQDNLAAVAFEVYLKDNAYVVVPEGERP